jgi:lipoic acid synthetase
VERGGDVTYHGPGQLVGYPILDLRGYRKDVGWYMHSLEEMIIKTLADFGIEARRWEGNIGVWIGQDSIAALGARIEDWITYHGFALNVCPNLSHFDLIVPCGYKDRGVTSMERVLGRAPKMEKVREGVALHWAEVFEVEVEEVSLEDILTLVKGGSI